MESQASSSPQQLRQSALRESLTKNTSRPSRERVRTSCHVGRPTDLGDPTVERRVIRQRIPQQVRLVIVWREPLCPPRQMPQVSWLAILLMIPVARSGPSPAPTPRSVRASRLRRREQTARR
jgi:hypothetical protein